jgi:hypothetical protein
VEVRLNTSEGRAVDIRQPTGAHVECKTEACPHCGEKPMKVQGTGKHIESHDTYAAGAICLCCGKSVGTLRARMDTIFGLEEDERVLVHGRARVY